MFTISDGYHQTTIKLSQPCNSAKVSLALVTLVVMDCLQKLVVIGMDRKYPHGAHSSGLPPAAIHLGRLEFEVKCVRVE
jgi:hypothetical protein